MQPLNLHALFVALTVTISAVGTVTGRMVMTVTTAVAAKVSSAL